MAVQTQSQIEVSLGRSRMRSGARQKAAKGFVSPTGTLVSNAIPQALTCQTCLSESGPKTNK
jgi:hypothetical protein